VNSAGSWRPTSSSKVPSIFFQYIIRTKCKLVVCYCVFQPSKQQFGKTFLAANFVPHYCALVHTPQDQLHRVATHVASHDTTCIASALLQHSSLAFTVHCTRSCNVCCKGTIHSMCCMLHKQSAAHVLHRWNPGWGMCNCRHLSIHNNEKEQQGNVDYPVQHILGKMYLLVKLRQPV
jgi:hypothetical protein